MKTSIKICALLSIILLVSCVNQGNYPGTKTSVDKDLESGESISSSPHMLYCRIRRLSEYRERKDWEYGLDVIVYRVMKNLSTERAKKNPDYSDENQYAFQSRELEKLVSGFTNDSNGDWINLADMVVRDHYWSVALRLYDQTICAQPHNRLAWKKRIQTTLDMFEYEGKAVINLGSYGKLVFNVMSPGQMSALKRKFSRVIKYVLKYFTSDREIMELAYTASLTLQDSDLILEAGKILYTNYPDVPKSYVYDASKSMAVKDWDGLKTKTEKWLEKHPRCAYGWNGLFMLYKEKGNAEKRDDARRRLQFYREFSPDFNNVDFSIINENLLKFAKKDTSENDAVIKKIKTFPFDQQKSWLAIIAKNCHFHDRKSFDKFEKPEDSTFGLCKLALNELNTPEFRKSGIIEKILKTGTSCMRTKSKLRSIIAFNWQDFPRKTIESIIKDDYDELVPPQHSFNKVLALAGYTGHFEDFFRARPYSEKLSGYIDAQFNTALAAIYGKHIYKFFNRTSAKNEKNDLPSSFEQLAQLLSFYSCSISLGDNSLNNSYKNNIKKIVKHLGPLTLAEYLCPVAGNASMTKFYESLIDEEPKAAENIKLLLKNNASTPENFFVPVFPDYEKGLFISFRDQCLKGNIVMCRELIHGIKVAEGILDKTIRSEIAPAADLLCQKSDDEACALLDSWIGDGFKYEGLKSTTNLAKPCENNLYQTCWQQLGRSKKDRNFTKDQVSQFEKGCDKNHFMSCSELGEIYWEGKVVKQDKEKYISLARKACNGGSGPSCLSLAQRHLDKKLKGINGAEDIFAFSTITACRIRDSNACEYVEKNLINQTSGSQK